MNLFVFNSLFKINDKINSLTPQVVFPLLLILTLDKQISFIKHLYFGKNNKSLKLQIQFPLLTLIIKGHGNCKISSFFKFSQKKNQNIINREFYKEKVDFGFAHKNKIK